MTWSNSTLFWRTWCQNTEEDRLPFLQMRCTCADRVSVEFEMPVCVSRVSFVSLSETGGWWGWHVTGWYLLGRKDLLTLTPGSLILAQFLGCTCKQTWWSVYMTADSWHTPGVSDKQCWCLYDMCLYVFSDTQCDTWILTSGEQSAEYIKTCPVH